jgi:hypothetical protein
LKLTEISDTMGACEKMQNPYVSTVTIKSLARTAASAHGSVLSVTTTQIEISCSRKNGSIQGYWLNGEKLIVTPTRSLSALRGSMSEKLELRVRSADASGMSVETTASALRAMTAKVEASVTYANAKVGSNRSVGKKPTRPASPITIASKPLGLSNLQPRKLVLGAKLIGNAIENFEFSTFTVGVLDLLATVVAILLKSGMLSSKRMITHAPTAGLAARSQKIISSLSNLVGATTLGIFNLFAGPATLAKVLV